MYTLYRTNNVRLPEGFYLSDKWDCRFLDLAKHVATWSKDPKTQVGAVITKANKSPVLGYNGFPSRVQDTPDRYKDYELKHKLVLHAEQNAIAGASRSLSGNTLYCTYPPCIRCSMQIISEGISRVVSLKSSDAKMKKHKVDIELSMDVFLEAGVRFDIYDEPTIKLIGKQHGKA